MSGQKHPDTETLASLRAGLVGGFRGRRLAAHLAGCARCAAVSDELGAVSSFLASTQAPPLPDAFERQITAAIAAEATARQSAAAAAGARPAAASPAAPDRGADNTAGAGVGAAGDIARQNGANGAPRGRHGRPPDRRDRHSRRFRLAAVLVPVAACLLAGVGYLLSGTTSPPVSGSYSESAPSAAAAAPSGLANGRGLPAAAPRPAAGDRVTFLVTSSGTRYQAATLRAQVRTRLAAQAVKAAPAPTGSSPAGFSAAGGASSSSVAGSTGGRVPSSALAGCVLHVTGDVTPSLVDEATYQGRAAYVIAVPGRAWVVAPGCTASNPSVIASVALTATP